VGGDRTTTNIPRHSHRTNALAHAAVPCHCLPRQAPLTPFRRGWFSKHNIRHAETKGSSESVMSRPLQLARGVDDL
jgi:hypothetical protein